jgi:hypothetical protein
VQKVSYGRWLRATRAQDAGRLAQLVSSQHQMMHIPKTGLIVGNRASEGAERSHQDLNAIEIGTHMVEYAMQLEPYSIYSRLRSH